MHKRVLGSEDVWSPKGETKPVGKFPCLLFDCPFKHQCKERPIQSRFSRRQPGPGSFTPPLLPLSARNAHAKDKILEPRHLPQIDTESHYKSTEIPSNTPFPPNIFLPKTEQHNIDNNNGHSSSPGAAQKTPGVGENGPQKPRMTYYNNGTQLTVISSPLLEKKLADLQ